jgi:hypothetical protein
MKPFDAYFESKDERTYINNLHPAITESWKYGMPFFCVNNKMFCYLWVHKKFHQPYIGIVEGNKIHHPLLVQEKRARMKILLLDPDKDVPVKVIDDILKKALKFYLK